ncbi:Imm52 family immunity protein [Caballeronia sp. LZ016]|nr:Imm52 family immunity protein [Caballeronia sp. LZ016]MDR5738076.1 Imm52 family immunity protein [Caballeronia sp. LZ016]
MSLQMGAVSVALGYSHAAKLIEEALTIWPALTVELAPYRYSADSKQIFPDRPGVGWMLYLPRRIEFEQVPEARMIRHVKDLTGTEGTIIISEIDGPFDADNPEHVKVANSIEIRLADQDLLPRYADL